MRVPGAKRFKQAGSGAQRVPRGMRPCVLSWHDVITSRIAIDSVSVRAVTLPRQLIQPSGTPLARPETGTHEPS